MQPPSSRRGRRYLTIGIRIADSRVRLGGILIGERPKDLPQLQGVGWARESQRLLVRHALSSEHQHESDTNSRAS